MNDLNLDGSVEFPGYRTDIPERLSEASALLMTSRWEGLPRIGLEAIAVGCPVFAFDVKGTRSLPLVSLAPDGDVEGLATRIVESVGKPDILMQRPETLSDSWVADEVVEFLAQFGKRRQG